MNLIICLQHSYFLCDLLEKHPTPIHEALAATPAKTEELVGQEIDMVRYSETPYPTNDGSTANLLTLCSDTMLAKDNSDSGVVQSDLESGITSGNSPSNTCNHQSVSFSSNCDEELINQS